VECQTLDIEEEEHYPMLQNPKVFKSRLVVGLIIGLVYWCALSFHATTPLTLPGHINKLASPNKRYVLVNIDSEAEPYHRLVLRDLASGKEKLLRTYARHISVAWSPNGESFFVNDYGASDFSDCYLYSPANEDKPVSIKEALKEQFGSDQHLWKNHHVYIECRKWLSETELLVRIKGYGDVDPSGFAVCYSYGLKGSFKPVPCDCKKGTGSISHSGS